MSNPPGATLDPRFASSHDETRSCGSQPAHISLTARRAPRPDRPPPQPTPMPAPAAGIPCWALDKRPSISAPGLLLAVRLARLTLCAALRARLRLGLALALVRALVALVRPAQLRALVLGQVRARVARDPDADPDEEHEQRTADEVQRRT